MPFPEFGQHVGKKVQPWESMLDYGNLPAKRVTVLTKPTGTLGIVGGHECNTGYVIVKEQDKNGTWQRFMVHINRLLAK